MLLYANTFSDIYRYMNNVKYSILCNIYTPGLMKMAVAQLNNMDSNYN